MSATSPYPGVKEFLRACGRKNVSVYIISHKTKYPYKGPEFDLHTAATEWLENENFFGADMPLTEEQVYFEGTMEDKLTRIEELNCDWFVDDLPEFLAEPGFPDQVGRILFDPHRNHEAPETGERFASWDELKQKLL